MQKCNNGAYYLGHVVAGSGMYRIRLNEDKRRVAVDWALIEMSSNRIHRQMHADEVSGNIGFRYSNNTSRNRIDRPYHGGSILDARDGMGLFKSGRSTGLTSFVLHSLGSVELDRLKSKQRHGYSFVINWARKASTSESTTFAEAGESGAWITRVDGMVFDDGAVEVRIAPTPVP
ncbi:uncharacterized protein N7518_000552 [Penicillium psychrosexuale]|uniref:uncharacterized protein n=1 Tax=Penicillium psychrosexuale TaxID=1002107 RepID=UPI002545A567|nr:uncharacterized protein N7518_000552 [Penicillium psychrosexuale]KAJ5804249.1 hypothetical protein N7518_000552 [Penicillium psychrosexuale]